jgi:hypothetical protein
MDWRCNSSGTGIALQVQSPEFEPESYQKKKKRKKENVSNHVLKSRKIFIKY